MDTNKRASDTDLQRGFEPLRTIFAVVVLLLGFAAAARAQDISALASENVEDGAMRARLNAIHDQHMGRAKRSSAELGRIR